MEVDERRSARCIVGEGRRFSKCADLSPTEWQMASVDDLAAYILKQQGRMTAMKLQKLVYYCQAWSLVWDDRPLFRARIEAWANGPVVPRLYAKHRGMLHIDTWEGDPEALTASERSTVRAVLEAYGDKTSQWLSDLTHREQPWAAARKGFAPGEQCTNEISLASMKEYYESLV
jgi:uncharacterized phage-associated protein